MSLSFKYAGADVVVNDEAFAEKLGPVVEGGSYSPSRLEQVAPNMMRAIRKEIQTLSDRRLVPKMFTVGQGKVMSTPTEPDTRRGVLKAGTKIGAV